MKFAVPGNPNAAAGNIDRKTTDHGSGLCRPLQSLIVRRCVRPHIRPTAWNRAPEMIPWLRTLGTVPWIPS